MRCSILADDVHNIGQVVDSPAYAVCASVVKTCWSARMQPHWGEEVADTPARRPRHVVERRDCRERYVRPVRAYMRVVAPKTNKLGANVAMRAGPANFDM